MYMGMGMSGEQRQEMRVSPSLIQYTQILQLSGVELRELIMRELEENPALRMEEGQLCPACGDPLRRDGSCYRCQRGERLEQDNRQTLVEAEDPSQDFDPLSMVADQSSLEEHLLAEVGAVIEDGQMPIAEYLIGELDTRGFLTMTVDLVAASLGVEVEDVEAVLAALQSVGPLGLGARDAQECLRIQLDRWEEIGASHPLARTLVTEHFEDLGAGRFAQLARELEVSQDDIQEARDFIRSHLRPYPIAESIDIEPWERDTGPGSAAPDVIVRLSEDGEDFEIEIVESRRYQLSLNPIYDELVGAIAKKGGADKAHMTEKEQGHVEESVRRAVSFLSHIQERRSTMRRVTEHVIERQAAFVRHGPRQAIALTRAQVAEALELHESTISRATKDKFVMLPSRQVVPFSAFFKAALSVQDVLREIVENEPKPYTDAELADLMAEAGHPISRRTVTKYRKQMGILPSTQR